MMNRTCGDEGKWKQKRKTDVWTGTRKKEKDSVEHCAHLTQHAARSIAWLVGVARSRGAPSLCEALWLTTPPCRYSASTVQYLTPCIPLKLAINISFNLNQGQFGLPLHLRHQVMYLSSFLSSLANACAYQSPRQRSHVTGSFLTHLKRGKKDGKVVRCRTDLYAVPRPAPRSTTEIQGLQHWVPVVQGRDIQKHLLSQETRKLGRSHGIMCFLTSHTSTRRVVSVVS